MKKELLLLFFLLPFTINAQIPPLGMQTPYNICDDASNDGYAVFDLTSTIPSILGSVDASIHEVHFYPSEIDAQNSTNEIANTASYLNIFPSIQVLGIRIFNTVTSATGFTAMNLIVNPLPTANPAALQFCDTTVLAQYDLPNAASQITANAPGIIVTYHETLVDAQANANPVGPGYIPLINPGTQVLHARVTNPITGCVSFTTLTLNTQNCGPCQPPTNVASSAVTFNSAVLNWTSTGSYAVWDVVALPAGSPPPATNSTGFITISSNPFTITGLTQNTSYDIYVRTVCFASLVTDWSGLTTFTTQALPPICGGNFTDQGGNTANYPNNSNFTTTICPNNPDEAVTVTFTSFNTEINFDALYVFDGNSASSSQIVSGNPAANVPGGLPGGYWGTTIPGPFTSTSQNGCLTFVFRSDTTNTLEGWIANVNCSPNICDVPTNITVANITNTSAIVNWNNSSGATTWEILTVPQGSPDPTAESAGSYTQTMPYVITDLSLGECYTVYLRSLCSSPSEWSSPVSFCMVNCENNGSCAENLNLIAFVDTNNNGIKDNDETTFNYGSFVYQINNSTTIQYGSSNSGSYQIYDSNPNNSYDISFSLNSTLTSYYTSSVSYNNVTLPTGSGANTLYFPVVNILPHVDARVSLINSGQPRPGFTYTVSILYQNYGSQTIPNGTLNFIKDPNLTITYVSEAGVIPTANGFSFDFTNLGPFQSRSLYVTFLVPTIPTVALGDLITNTSSIQINSDIDLTNNTAQLTQTIVGSYDPNDKIESHGGKILHADFTANDYLYYTIQFENTGTASAEFVRVEDLLDAKLDKNTFEMISASHNVNTKREDNQLTWHFYNINLPPTVTDPIGSHGYVYFKIKPRIGYAIGDIIPNNASIFFDYNPAIVTATFNSEFVQFLGTTTFNTGTVSLFPNPASTYFSITNSNTSGKISSIAIYDSIGKKLFTAKNILQTNINIDVSNFAKGIYLVEITSDTNQKLTKKLMVQ